MERGETRREQPPVQHRPFREPLTGSHPAVTTATRFFRHGNGSRREWPWLVAVASQGTGSVDRPPRARARPGRDHSWGGGGGRGAEAGLRHSAHLPLQKINLRGLQGQVRGGRREACIRRGEGPRGSAAEPPGEGEPPPMPPYPRDRVPGIHLTLSLPDRFAGRNTLSSQTLHCSNFTHQSKDF